MPRHRLRVRVVAVENAAALQPALEQALAEEQVDRSWHVSEVTLAAGPFAPARAGAVTPEPYVALISLRKQEWFFMDLLTGLVDAVRRKPSPPDDAAGS